MPRSFDEAQRRIPSQKQKIINVLRDAGEEGVTNTELVQISLKYDARLSELYKEGYIITNEHLGNGVYKYVLKAMPGQLVFYPDALSTFINGVAKNRDGMIAFEDIPELLDELDINMCFKAGYYKRQMSMYY